MCSVGVGMSKHGFAALGRFRQKGHMFWSSEYFIRFIVWLHAQNLKDKPIGGDIKLMIRITSN